MCSKVAYCSPQQAYSPATVAAPPPFIFSPAPPAVLWNPQAKTNDDGHAGVLTIALVSTSRALPTSPSSWKPQATWPRTVSTPLLSTYLTNGLIYSSDAQWMNFSPALLPNPLTIEATRIFVPAHCALGKAFAKNRASNMKPIMMRYPGFQSLPKGLKQMLVESESFFFEEETTFIRRDGKPAFPSLATGNYHLPAERQVSQSWNN
jgi:hypothetical protein